MSSDVHSGIFTDLLEYYRNFCDEDIQIIDSVNPIEDADIYHYHRPHLEENLKNNSVVTVHHDINDTDDWLNYDKFHDRYNEAKLILCLNKTQESILSRHGLKHTRIIPHGFNNSIFTYAKNIKKISEKVNIGIISKRYGRKVKGEAYLFELMKRLDREKFKFIFVGVDRSISSLKAESMGFESVCYERLPYYCFGDLYDKLNYLLVTSLFEGGPANIPEAVASSTPIISTPIGMSNDYIKHCDNGLILSGNIEEDAELIEHYSHKENYEKISTSAFNQKQAALSWQEVMRLTSDCYKELIGK
ncbi:glycosyltransferase family 4 protein [Pantoea sp. JGM49]|nr:glycosyltransferase family 4 protein [Pantoea sp. JGM49]